MSPLRSTLFLMLAVMVTKAASTLLPLSADVSTNGMSPISLAMAAPSAEETVRALSGRSALLPTRTHSRSCPPSCLALSYQTLTRSNESRRDMSYTSSAPCAPL